MLNGSILLMLHLRNSFTAPVSVNSPKAVEGVVTVLDEVSVVSALVVAVDASDDVEAATDVLLGAVLLGTVLVDSSVVSSREIRLFENELNH